MSTTMLRGVLLGALGIAIVALSPGCAQGAGSSAATDDAGDDDDPRDDGGGGLHIDARVGGNVDATATADGGPPAADPALIDDLEDGNDAIRGVAGRVGSWYTFHDTTVAGVQVPGDDFTPAAGGAGGSAYCAATTGHGFTDWGAGLGFDLNSTMPALKGTYDATAYTGISFMAKGNVAIRFAVETTGVLPTDLGGSCTPSMVAGQECDDVHGKTLTLTTSWQEYQVPFTQLVQEGWGKPVPFDRATTTAVVFQMGPNLMFDLSIDDVRLY